MTYISAYENFVLAIHVTSKNSGVLVHHSSLTRAITAVKDSHDTIKVKYPALSSSERLLLEGTKNHATKQGPNKFLKLYAFFHNLTSFHVDDVCGRMFNIGI